MAGCWRYHRRWTVRYLEREVPAKRRREGPPVFDLGWGALDEPLQDRVAHVGDAGRVADRVDQVVGESVRERKLERFDVRAVSTPSVDKLIRKSIVEARLCSVGDDCDAVGLRR